MAMAGARTGLRGAFLALLLAQRLGALSAGPLLQRAGSLARQPGEWRPGGWQARAHPAALFVSRQAASYGVSARRVWVQAFARASDRSRATAEGAWRP